MNILLSCVGRRSYLPGYFRPHLGPEDRIIGTSNTSWTPAFASCDRTFVLPDIGTADYVPSLLNLCKDEKIRGLLSLFDPDIEVLSEHLAAFREIGTFPIVCSAEVSHLCFDKYRAYTFLKDHQVDAPATFTELQQVRRAMDQRVLAFPLMVKPRFGYGSHHVFIARSMRELEVFFEYAPDMIVQAMASGTEHHLDVFVGPDGQVVSVVPKRKVRMRSGETDQAVTVIQPDLMDVGIRLGQILGRLGHVGPLDVDVFVDHQDVTVLEMNPRFGGAYPAAHLAGADFPGLVVSILRGERIEPCLGRFESGVTMVKDYHILSGPQFDPDEKKTRRSGR